MLTDVEIKTNVSKCTFINLGVFRLTPNLEPPVNLSKNLENTKDLPGDSSFNI